MDRERRARLFVNGRSQAVRIPAAWRFHCEEVRIRREGKRLVIEPIDEWPDEFRALKGTWPESIERPPQTKQKRRGEL